MRGHRVFEAHGIQWAHYRGPFFCSLPFERRIDLEPQAISEMLRRHGVRCVRFPSARNRGVPIGLYFCRPREYALEKLPRQFRRHVQRGLESCEIRPVEPAELLRQGLQLNRETMERQKRYDPEFGNPARWKRFVDAVRQSPGVTVTGAYIDGQLSTYIVCFREGSYLHMLYKMSRSVDRSLPIGHAVDYRVVTDAASDPGIEIIENSFTSLVPNEGLDAYKRHMGFSIDHCHLEIHFHPRIAPLLGNRLTVAAVNAAWKRRPKDARLELGAKVLEGARLTMTNHFPIINNSTPEEQECQHTGCLTYSKPWRPHALFLLRVAVGYLRKEGFVQTVRKTVDYVRNRGSHPTAAVKNAPRPAAVAKVAPRPATAGEVLSLQPGDWVQVKTEAEIRATLDGQDKHRGLLFVPREMLAHCGKHYQVKKRVEKIFLEESRQNRKLKNTVTLEGVQCQGQGLDCDRCCYLFWREAWLKKIDPPAGREQGR